MPTPRPKALARQPAFWQSRGLPAWLLWPLSLLFQLLARLRRECYASGRCASWRAPVPVVVIGNINVGGAGKTPLTLAIAQMMTENGVKPGIVTRGYRGRSAVWPLSVSVDSSAELAGDEALLLARRSGVPVVAAPDRVAAVKRLLEQHRCDLVLSDDGLQHYRLQRDAEIVVVPAAGEFGNRFCLPAGPLREPVSRLDGVDLVVHSGEQRQSAGYRLQPEPQLTGVCDWQASLDPAKLPSPAVHAVAGIAHPTAFFATLRDMGLQPVEHPFADHHHYTAADLLFADQLPVVMTEKDAVKCSDFDLPNLWYLRVHAVLDASIESAIERMLAQLLTGEQGVN